MIHSKGELLLQFMNKPGKAQIDTAQKAQNIWRRKPFDVLKILGFFQDKFLVKKLSHWRKKIIVGGRLSVLKVMFFQEFFHSKGAFKIFVGKFLSHNAEKLRRSDLSVFPKFSWFSAHSLYWLVVEYSLLHHHSFLGVHEITLLFRLTRGEKRNCNSQVFSLKEKAPIKN